MKREGRSATLGVASHSGWAAVVAIGGTRADPCVLLRVRLDLAEAGDGSAKQPFHAAEGMPVPKARAFLASFRADARRRARRELKRILTELSATGARVRACAILTAAASEPRALESILASHALIHAAEGEHFRDAVAWAAEGAGIPVARIPRKTLAESASRTLGRPSSELDRRIAEMRKAVGAPWGSDQKQAALAAWSILGGGGHPSDTRGRT